jgi:hypothetical protein
MAYNFHSNAAALILAAAKMSGLLDSVAEALRFIDKDCGPQSDCPACELLSYLTDAFVDVVDDDRVGASVEQFFGESWEGFPRYSEEELRPYFTIPFEVHVGTKPPRSSIDFDKVYDAGKAKAEIKAERLRIQYGMPPDPTSA